MSAADFPRTEWIWKNGDFVRWEDASLHVMSHVVHYGSSVFEGIRSYETPAGPTFFRLGDHLRRFVASARVHRMPLAHTMEDLVTASRELVARNGLESCYLRPVAFRGLGAAGIDPSRSPVEVFLVCWAWDAYLGAKSLEEGVDCGVSSWLRPAPNTHPTMAKAGGNYLNASLMKMEARSNGFDEAIALSVDGTLSEGSGQNLFLVRDGEIHTPAVDGSFLQGVTRDSVIRLARDMGVTVHEERIPREALYVADEVFLTGTATEVVPVRSVDGITVGPGRRGPVTGRLQERFMALVRGRVPDPYGWRSPAHPATPASAAVG